MTTRTITRTAVQSTVAVLIVTAVILGPALLLAAGAWWAVLGFSAVATVFVVKGRMWRP